ncbi:MAG: nucleotidyltransferase family protein [Thaumarchaeota archaeon]|nr:nucleotidyltransferase family protein [Nitrososphaerota archaeon]
MKAIVLAGGLGMRLRPLTDDRPKALIEVSRKPIAEYQLEWLAKETQMEQVIFACGYKWERLKEHFGTSYGGVPITYSVEQEPLGTGGAIKMAISQAGGEDLFVVTNGDIITDLPLHRMVDAHRQAGEMTASMLVVPYRSRFGVVKIDKLRMVRGFEEKPAFPDVWINGGVYILSPRRILKSLPETGDIERETFPKLVTHGELVSYPHYGEWFFIDSIKDLKEIEDTLRPTTAG